MFTKVRKILMKFIVVAIVSIVTILSAMNFSNLFASTDNHYVVDVKKEKSTNKDSNIEAVEVIKRGENNYFDSKKLDYELQLKNIATSETTEIQVAILIDSSYSMEINDSNNLVNQKAKELSAGILNNVVNSKISIIDNKEIKMQMTKFENQNTITNANQAIDNCVIGDGSTLNTGLENAVNSFRNPQQGYALKQYIIVFTDSTEDVSKKIKEYDEEGITVIVVSVDLTSNAYLDEDGTPLHGQFYLIPDEVNVEDLEDTISVYEVERIYTELNRKVTDILVENIFSDEVRMYFDISEITVDKGTIERTENGYKWTIDELKKQVTAKLSYTIELKDDVEIDAGSIFSEICTNRIQGIIYRDYTGRMIELKGSDGREGTESTVIKISKGYDVKIHAVNEENEDLPVDGIELKVIAQDENGQKVMELDKTTDSNGDIVIYSSEDGADALRRDGKLIFTVKRNTGIVKVGYADTYDTIVFSIKNNRVTRLLDWIDNESNLKYSITESKRLVSVTMPISSQKMDLEIRVEELNNSNITISDAKFELIQPKLNNNYEMDVLQGTTDSDGVIHFEPTIMTKSGNYTYILRQITTQEGYECTRLSLITMHFDTEGKIDVEPTVQYNPNVIAERLGDNHVLITVKNENVQGDPIDFTINLSDSEDETIKLQGVTYLIKTINSNNQSRTEYVTTDENGQIKTKIYGTGLLLVDVTEQMPKVGYKADTKTKELTINKVDGEVKVPQVNPTEYVDKISTGINRDELILNLTSIRKVEQNIVNLEIVDSIETDTAIGKGVIYELVEIKQEENENTGLLEETEGAIYGPLATDRKGQIKFTIDTNSQGNHIYELRVNEDSLPDEYNNDINKEKVRFGLIFDEDGFVVGKFDVSTGNLEYTMDNSTLNNQASIEYTAFVTLMYELNISNMTEFKIDVRDYDNRTQKIEGSTYDIHIEWEINGVTREKEILGRKTNANGLITTNITKSSLVKISVKQVNANAGYKIDYTTQEIFVEYGNNGLVSRMTQSPYDLGATNTDEPHMGADIDGTRQIVTYHHLNKKRTVEDTFVNLTINLNTQEGLVAEKVLEIESETLKDKNGDKLDLIKLAKNGEIKIDYASYIQDLVNQETIQVPGIGIDGEEIVYDLKITTVKEDNPGDPDTTYTKQPGTTVELRLIFRYTDGRVRLTNVETIYGNRLVQNKTYSSSADTSEDELGIFLGNVILKLYTDFDDIGNLGLDIKKVNANGDYLVGGKYSIKVTNPDRSIIRTEKIIQNGDSNDDIEIKGINVNVGSIIEITEIEAPIGYAVNSDTEIFEVTELDDFGRIKLEHTNDAYEVSRLVISDPIYETTGQGTVKTSYNLLATDYELNTFSFGITTKEVTAEGTEAIGGYKFKINSNRGAQGFLTTKGRTNIIKTDDEVNENEEMNPEYTKVGGNIENDTNVYTVTPVNTPDYYRPITRMFDVIVVFTPTGEIDVTETINQNTLAAPGNGYGELWTISSTEPAVPGKIAIDIIVQKQHTFTVKVKTLDVITNAEILNSNYTVSGYNAQVLSGYDSREVVVGYITENGIKNYTLEQTSMQNSYQKVSNLDFSIRYSNSEIEADNVQLINSSEGETIEKTGVREVTIKRYAEPKVPFEILNEYYFDSSKKLDGAIFEVESLRNNDKNEGITDTTGTTGIYSDILGGTEGETVIYKIVNKKASNQYATIDDFFVKVKYNSNREITSAELVDENGIATTNKFVTVGFKKTSTFSSYNSNNKGIVDIKVRSYPEFLINIKNIDRTDDTKDIAGTSYNVTSQYLEDNNIISFMSSYGNITDSTGSVSAKLNKVKTNKIVEYTISEASHAAKYQELGQDIKIKVTFNDEGYVTNVELSNSAQSNIAEVSKISPIVNIEDNFKVNLVIKNNPTIKINIFNVDRGDETIPVIGAKFAADSVYSGTTLLSGVNSVDTAINGKTLIEIDKTKDNASIEYTIKEIDHATDYQELGKDIKFTVRYDENGYISDIALDNGLDAISEVSKVNPIVNVEDNFEINLKLRSKPVLRINIKNVDRRDGTTLVNGAVYTIESSYSGGSLTAMQQENATSGLAVAKIYKTIDNTVVTYDIKEKSPAAGYQTFGADLKLRVTYDQNGYVSDAVIDNINNLSGIVSVSKVSPIVNSEDNFTINLELRSNPILRFDITAEDSQNHNVKIDGLRFTMVGKEGNIVYSNSSATNIINTTANPEASAVTGSIGTAGYTALYMDKTLDNKEMYYVVTEVQKASGYNWNDSEIVLKVAYDGNGAISTVSVDRGGEFANISSYDSDLFSIQLEVYNEQVKEFGINLITEDVYDKQKKINDFEVEAWLTDPEGQSYISDGKYELIGNNKLKTGADRDGDGNPDIAYGEDYMSMGQYVEGAGTRNLRLEIKNTSLNGSKGYYSNTGYYKGNKYFEDTYYQYVTYKYLLSVTFDDEGRIVNAGIQTGENNILGWLADNRYIEVQYNPGGYKLNVTLKFYPMLKLNIQAVDNYEAEDNATQHINDDGSITLEYNPTALSGSSYVVSTQRHSSSGRTYMDEYVTAGYIGRGHYLDINQPYAYGDIYEATDTLYVPIEAGTTRKFYVFEYAEPTNYQQYRPKLVHRYEERLVSIISIKFDEYGEIVYEQSVERYSENSGNISIVKPYRNEDNTGYLSHNNINEYNYYAKHVGEDSRNLNFYIGYALTTTINIQAVDDISGTPISSIRMTPLLNNTYLTNSYYAYTTISYSTTNTNGETNAKYWGASIPKNTNRYIIGSYQIGTNYNGYLFPSDMTNGAIGGKGNASDYYAIIDVQYDEKGKISNVKSVGKDLWGDNNVREDITWDPVTGNINIKMLYSRRFQTKFYKVDYDDATINNLNAAFSLVSDKGLRESFNAGQIVTLGKVYKNSTVKYTLSETQVPSEYYPIQDSIDFYVEFDKDGNIGRNSITSVSDYFEVVNISDTTENLSKTNPDLTVNLKNKQALTLNMRVIDEYYTSDGLANVHLEIKNNKGDIAAGNPQTDRNGNATVIAGPIYRNETIVYDIKQITQIDGYYPNEDIIKLEVTYTGSGRIQQYRIIDGNDRVYRFDESSSINTRNISMQVTNKPKDIKIGLYKYDKTTGLPMPGVEFEVTAVDVNTGVKIEKTFKTENTGYIIGTIGTFEVTNDQKLIKYTIHEKETPLSYRNIEDIVYTVRYGKNGSMIRMTQVANENGDVSSIRPEAAISSIKVFDGERVHMTASIPNDNAFDIEIKNEDSRFDGLGISGTSYDVSVNGKTYTPSSTNVDGIATVNDITETGDITIRIAEKTIGDGYLDDINNNIEIKLAKGTDIYSLDLLEETEGYLDSKNALTSKPIKIQVDEVHGKIIVTFKNKTQTDLTLIHRDAYTAQRLANAEFEIISQQIDDNGIPIGNTTSLTTQDNYITNENGELHFNLGESPVSQIIKYTFTEITTPGEEYNLLAPLEMTIKYDQYGRIKEQTSNMGNRLKCTTEHSSDNCRNIYAIIYDGNAPVAYTVKVVTEDVDTGRRISGSEIKLNIVTESGEQATQGSSTNASMINNGTDVKETANLGIDGNMYTDAQISTSTNPPVILERGLVYMDGITQQGRVKIEVSEQQAAQGYETGMQKHVGIVELESTFVTTNDSSTIKFNVIDNDGFRVITDERNMQLTIVILNESRINLELTTLQFQVDQTVPVSYIPGVSYEITSRIITATDSIDTDLNETMPITDINGWTSQNVGKAYAGKTIVYRLHQNTPDGYNKIDDIEVEIQYDSKGNIRYYEMLSSEDNCYIDKTKTKDRTISLVVKNKKQLSSYIVYIEKHAKDTANDVDAYGRLLPNAKYEITVEEQFGKESTTWVDVTDENGEIHGLTFNGTGFITITIRELEAPKGYAADTLRYLRLYRDTDTGGWTEVDSNVNYRTPETSGEIDLNGNEIIRLIPVDEQLKDKFTLDVNKISAETGRLIKEAGVEFKFELVQNDENGGIGYYDLLGTVKTDENGMLSLNDLCIPQEAGEYNLVITEIKEPTGYIKLEDSIKIPVRFGQTEDGNMIIKGINLNEIEEASLSSQLQRQLIPLNIINEVGNNLSEDEYMLDITKVDYDTGEPIEDMAIFKVLLPEQAFEDNSISVYTETKENLLGVGKLDYCYIEQDRDYNVRLTNMKLPQGEEKLKYVFTEIVAPKGYKAINEDLELEIEFKLDEETNEMYIANVTSSNPEYLRINTETPCSKDTRIEVDILNKKGSETQFTIHYDANDDANGANTFDLPTDQIKEKDNDILLSVYKPIRDGYIFDGWSFLPDGEVKFQPGDKFTLNQDTTLYAKWEEKLYLESTQYYIGDGQEDQINWSPGKLSKYEDGNLYVKGIRPRAGLRNYTEGTYLEEFLANIQTNADEIKIYIPEVKDDEIVLEKELEDKTDNSEGEGLIGTGMILKLKKGKRQEIQITLIVRGDLLKKDSLVGDGIVKNTEAQRVKTLTARTLTTNYTVEEQQAIDYYLNVNNRWNVNKQAITEAYQKKIVKPIRQGVDNEN